MSFLPSMNDQVNRRTAICNVCPNKTNNGSCDVCGVLLRQGYGCQAKIADIVQRQLFHCPIGKW